MTRVRHLPTELSPGVHNAVTITESPVWARYRGRNEGTVGTLRTSNSHEFSACGGGACRTALFKARMLGARSGVDVIRLRQSNRVRGSTYRRPTSCLLRPVSSSPRITGSSARLDPAPPAAVGCRVRQPDGMVIWRTAGTEWQQNFHGLIREQ